MRHALAAQRAVAGLTATAWHDSAVAATKGRTVFRGTAGSLRAFVKVYDNPAPLMSEVRNLALAKAAGVPVPDVLAFNQEPPATLVLSEVAGHAITSADPVHAWRQVGHLVHKLTEITQAPPYDADVSWPELVVRRMREELDEWVMFGAINRATAQRLVKRVIDLVPLLARRGLAYCHNDLQPDHVIVGAAGRIAGIVDWADARVADPLLDLAVVSMEPGAPTNEVFSGFAEPLPEAAALIPCYRLLKHVGGANWLRRVGRPDRAAVIDKAGLDLALRMLGPL